MADDFSKIYLDLYDLNKRIYDMETTHLQEEGSNMVKIIEYNISYNAGAINVSRIDSGIISQFQKVVIKANLIDFPVNDYAVRLHLSSATYSDGNENTYDDFQFHNYMIPQASGYNTFMINLNKTLGDVLIIGDANECPLIFEVLDGTNSSYSNILVVELYKSNTTQDYTPDDLVSIFIKLNDLTARQDELEGL